MRPRKRRAVTPGAASGMHESCGAFALPARQVPCDGSRRPGGGQQQVNARPGDNGRNSGAACQAHCTLATQYSFVQHLHSSARPHVHPPKCALLTGPSQFVGVRGGSAGGSGRDSGRHAASSAFGGGRRWAMDMQLSRLNAPPDSCDAARRCSATATAATAATPRRRAAPPGGRTARATAGAARGPGDIGGILFQLGGLLWCSLAWEPAFELPRLLEAGYARV